MMPDYWKDTNLNCMHARVRDVTACVCGMGWRNVYGINNMLWS